MQIDKWVNMKKVKKKNTMSLIDTHAPTHRFTRKYTCLPIRMANWFRKNITLMIFDECTFKSTNKITYTIRNNSDNKYISKKTPMYLKKII